jgi:phospholipid/cholesterol/gamma-HCH transport system substrate-binding protein
MRLSVTKKMALLGTALLLVVVATVGFILEGFTGHFSTYDVVYADIPASGTGIQTGSTVIYRDVTVGEIGSLGQQQPNGLLRVELHIDPQDLDAIPSGVKADVEIATVFGTQGINLVPPSTPFTTHLAIDQVVPSVGVSTTTTLQGDATAIDNLLNALHPADIYQTLTALATGLRAQGKSVGKTIDNIALYLTEMVPTLPQVENDISLLGPVANQLNTATPSILNALQHGSVTSQTITAYSNQIDQLLAGASPTANNLTQLLENTQASFEDLVANAAPLLGDVNANPNFVADTLAGFDKWSKAFAAAEEQGPYLSFSGDIDVAGAVQVVAAALGLPGTEALVESGLGKQNFNPPTYTAADCPTYGTERGPNCPANAANNANATNSLITGQTMTTPAEEAAAVRIATGIDKDKKPPNSAVTTLLLEPLLLELSGHGSSTGAPK